MPGVYGKVEGKVQLARLGKVLICIVYCHLQFLTDFLIEYDKKWFQKVEFYSENDLPPACLFKSFDDKLQINLPDLKLYPIGPVYFKNSLYFYSVVHESLVSVQTPPNAEAVIDYHTIY